jgi:hypothetical protein
LTPAWFAFPAKYRTGVTQKKTKNDPFLHFFFGVLHREKPHLVEKNVFFRLGGPPAKKKIFGVFKNFKMSKSCILGVFDPPQKDPFF